MLNSKGPIEYTCGVCVSMHTFMCPLNPLSGRYTGNYYYWKQWPKHMFGNKIILFSALTCLPKKFPESLLNLTNWHKHWHLKLKLHNILSQPQFLCLIWHLREGRCGGRKKQYLVKVLCGKPSAVTVLDRAVGEEDTFSFTCCTYMVSKNLWKISTRDSRKKINVSNLENCSRYNFI